MFKHILLPTDGSETSLRAVQKGADLAKVLGAEVTVMTAIEHFPAGIVGGAYRPDAQVLNNAPQQAANERLEVAEQLVKAAGVTTCHRILSQEHTVYQSILAAANTAGADLIVMGTHGMGALERMLVGSQTQRVLAHTKLPVLTLH